MLTIMMGDFGSGKTRTAKYMARKYGGKFLDCEIIGRRSGRYITVEFINEMKKIIKPFENYYIDGVFGTMQDGAFLSSELGIPVRYVVCMASPTVIKKRQTRKAVHVTTVLPRTEESIINVINYQSTIALSCSIPMFADTTYYPPQLLNRETWLRRWQELMIYSEFKNKRIYQDIDLSDRLYLKGYTDSYKTWDRLHTLVEFQGKSVLDLGCHYGYFCFKAEESKARETIGFDSNYRALKVADRIAVSKSSKVIFKEVDISIDKLPQADIVLALNVLHHLKYKSELLQSMFNQFGMVVLEIPIKDFEIIEPFAKDNNFPPPVMCNSHREGRAIYVYSKNVPAVVPRRYVYNYRREVIKKFWIHGILGRAGVVKRLITNQIKNIRKAKPKPYQDEYIISIKGK